MCNLVWLVCKGILLANSGCEFLVVSGVEFSSLHLFERIQVRRSEQDNRQSQPRARRPGPCQLDPTTTMRRVYTFRSPSHERLIFLTPSNNLTVRTEPREGIAGTLAIVMLYVQAERPASRISKYYRSSRMYPEIWSSTKGRAYAFALDITQSTIAGFMLSTAGKSMHEHPKAEGSSAGGI
jgi:hypothetical protein